MFMSFLRRKKQLIQLNSYEWPRHRSVLEMVTSSASCDLSSKRTEVKLNLPSKLILATLVYLFSPALSVTALKSIVTASFDGVVRTLWKAAWIQSWILTALRYLLCSCFILLWIRTVMGTSFVPEFKRCRFSSFGRSATRGSRRQRSEGGVGRLVWKRKYW